MTNLVNQPSAAPTRKVTAMTVALALTEAAIVIASQRWPIAADPAIAGAAQVVVTFLAGWITRERIVQ